MATEGNVLEHADPHCLRVTECKAAECKAEPKDECKAAGAPMWAHLWPWPAVQDPVSVKAHSVLELPYNGDAVVACGSGNKAEGEAKEGSSGCGEH